MNMTTRAGSRRVQAGDIELEPDPEGEAPANDAAANAAAVIAGNAAAVAAEAAVNDTVADIQAASHRGQREATAQDNEDSADASRAPRQPRAEETAPAPTPPVIRRPTPGLQRLPPGPEPTQWFGLESPENGNRVLATTPAELLQFNELGFHQVTTFFQRDEAQSWASHAPVHRSRVRTETGGRNSEEAVGEANPAAGQACRRQVRQSWSPHREERKSHRRAAERAAGWHQGNEDKESEDDSSDSDSSRERRAYNDHRRRVSEEKSSTRVRRPSRGISEHKRGGGASRRPPEAAGRSVFNDSGSSSSSPSSSDRSRSGRSRRKKKKKKKGKRRSKPRYKSPSSSPSSSSSDSESSSPARRDSEGLLRQKLPKGKSLLKNDTSSTSEELFGMEMGSDRLLSSLGPSGATRSMAKELFNYPTDVQSLPGGWSTNAGEESYGSEQTLSHLAAFLKTGPHSKHQGHDPGWNNKSHHALGKVKDHSDLETLAEDYASTKKRALAYEARRLQDWMRAHHYSSKEVEEYQRTGGLPLVLRLLDGYYLDLLTTLRTTVLKYPGSWHQSYAKVMLEHHRKELGHIRGMAGSRKDFLLTSYTYLRDSSRAKWVNQEVQTAWGMVIHSSLPMSIPQGDGGGQRRRACRCQNQGLHTSLQVSYFDSDGTNCPVAGASSAQLARTAAKILKTKVDSHSGGPPPKATWKALATKAIEAAVAGRESI